MALIKTVAKMFNKDTGVFEGGEHVEMSPLEETAEFARWKVGDSEMLKPQPLTRDEEHELLISDGVDAIKKARSEYADKLKAWEAEHAPIVEAHRVAHEAFLKESSGG